MLVQASAGEAVATASASKKDRNAPRTLRDSKRMGSIRFPVSGCCPGAFGPGGSLRCCANSASDCPAVQKLKKTSPAQVYHRRGLNAAATWRFYARAPVRRNLAVGFQIGPQNAESGRGRSPAGRLRGFRADDAFGLPRPASRCCRPVHKTSGRRSHGFRGGHFPAPAAPDTWACGRN